MIRDEYSPYKIVHLQDHLAAFRAGLQPVPVEVHLIPTNRCNQSCSFCAYRMPESPSNQRFDVQDEIPEKKLFEIIDSCKDMGIRAIQVTGGGEPLVHPAIKPALRRMLERGMEVGLVTNGMALDDELIEILRRVSWVRISVDAASRETYSMIRRVRADRFDRLLLAIRSLAESERTCILGIGFVVNRENHTEIYDACSMFREIGADNFRISAAFTPSGMAYFDGILDTGRQLAARAKAEFQTDRFTVFNLFADRIADIFHGVQDYDRCFMKDLVPYIGADQNVYTCCMLAYNQHGMIGSLRDRTFRQLWEGAHKVALFEAHSPRRTCRIPCMFEGKNDFIAYCVRKNPRHVCFP